MTTQLLCFSAMQAEVKRLVKTSDANTTLAIPGFINREIRAFNSEDFMDSITEVSAFTTVASQGLYQMNADCVDIKDVWTLSCALKKAEFSDIVNTDPDLDTTGDVVYWAEREVDSSNKKQIFLYPLPDAAVSFSVRSHIKLTEMTDSDDYIQVPPEFESIQDLIITGAARMVSLSQNDLERYKVLSAEYRFMKAKLKEANDRKKDEDKRFGWGDFTRAGKEMEWTKSNLE